MSEVQSYSLMFFIIGASFMWLVLKIISIVKESKAKVEDFIRYNQAPKPKTPIKVDESVFTPTAKAECLFDNVKEAPKTPKPDITPPARPTTKDKGLRKAKNPPKMPEVKPPKKETPAKKKVVKKKNVRK